MAPQTGGAAHPAGLLLLLAFAATTAWAQSVVIIENQVTGPANGQDSYVDVPQGNTNLRGQTFWTGAVGLTGSKLRLTSLSINVKASTSPVTITLSIYKFPTNQYHPLANDVPIFTNGPTSYTLLDPFGLDPSLGTYQPLTFDLRIAGQGLLVEPSTGYGITFTPQSGAFILNKDEPPWNDAFGRLHNNIGQQLSQPAASFSASAQPAASFSASAQPAASFSASAQPAASFSASAQPATSFSASAQPAASFSASAQPAASFSASTQPAASFSASAQPAASLAKA
ncbi:hypothetical protein D9Q98_004141 [Chlorella vulgaris]|uniref:Uncharacterized protein n=1 Tax=Chlorella vulgaris TaxID=3077 RepID=A0A9D4YYC6_CHLVU|nr:hypothetical protein D9Q98_004141 [Chlorella vulgaris]